MEVLFVMFLGENWEKAIRPEPPIFLFSCRRSRADLVVSFGVLVVHVHVHVLVLEPLPLLSE